MVTALVVLSVLALGWIWGYVYREPLVQQNRVAYWLITVMVLAAIAVFAATPASRP